MNLIKYFWGFFIIISFATNTFAETKYPAHWWTAIPRDRTTPEWEILPQEALLGEVIVSKRHELGILSNFAATPFVLNGLKFASVEGLWQSMKYPENDQDPRATFPKIKWPFTRSQVEQMVSFAAKDAGNEANQLMEQMNIEWVSFQNVRFSYYVNEKGTHYKIIRQALWEKIKQNPKVSEILLSTGDLILKPDHHQEASSPPAWKYCEIWMEIRARLQAGYNHD